MGGSAYQPGMAPNPNAAPILFDRPLLRARQQRALRAGPATFLLDRVVEDAAERLQAVLREFNNAADIGTPGDQVRDRAGWRASVNWRGSICPIASPSRWHCSRNSSISRFPRSPFNSSTICRACWRRSAARSGPTGSCWRR